MLAGKFFERRLESNTGEDSRWILVACLQEFLSLSQGVGKRFGLSAIRSNRVLGGSHASVATTPSRKRERTKVDRDLVAGARILGNVSRSRLVGVRHSAPLHVRATISLLNRVERRPSGPAS